jgi:hypothetical protein
VNPGVAALVMGAWLSACTAWPPHGQGGMAERRVPDNSREELPDELKEQLAVLKQDMERAQRMGLLACQPANALTLQRQLASSQRNLYGGMTADAQLSLTNAERTLAELQGHAGPQAGICHPSGGAVNRPLADGMKGPRG